MRTYKRKYHDRELELASDRYRFTSQISELKADILLLSSESETAKELIKLRGLVSRLELYISQAIADSMALTANLKLKPSSYLESNNDL